MHCMGAYTTWLQANMHDVARKMQRKQEAGGMMGGSMAVSASALGSKDSLYTIQDAPAAPQHRIPAAPAQVGQGSAAVKGTWQIAEGPFPGIHAASAAADSDMLTAPCQPAYGAWAWLLTPCNPPAPLS